MSHIRKSSAKTILPAPGAAVKGRVVAAGLALSLVAARAGFAKSTLSDYLAGRITSRHGQIRIAEAFGALTNQVISPIEFWDGLWRR